MEIEDTIKRESYRGFSLTQLRAENATETRWKITHKESGMYRDYGFTVSVIEARSRVDDLLK